MRGLFVPPPGRWLFLPSGPGEHTALEVREVAVEGRSRYQRYAIVDTVAFGQALILDGQLQSCTFDEWIYHESLVVPAMCVPEAPKRVAILGGGEGATLREVLAHPSVEAVTMVDIDGEVVAACREHLKSHHRGAFDDPRVTYLADDARAWLEGGEAGIFDVVVVDLTDPLDGGPSLRLFTREFYELVREALAPGGAVAVQAGGVRPNLSWAFGRVVRTLEHVFPRVVPYAAWVTSFFEEWGFAVAGGPEVEALRGDLVARRLAARGLEPRFLDGDAFVGLRSLSRYVRDEIRRAEGVLTDARPLTVER